jgi:hypothetical protein
MHRQNDAKTSAALSVHGKLSVASPRTAAESRFAKFEPLEEMRALHDCAFETERADGDVILGYWIHI